MRHQPVCTPVTLPAHVYSLTRLSAAFDLTWCDTAISCEHCLTADCDIAPRKILWLPIPRFPLYIQPGSSISLSRLAKMSNQSSESTNSREERPEWQEEGFNSRQEWQDWLNESEATDNAYDAQAEAPPPDDSEEDEGFDEEFFSEQDSEDEDDDDKSESGEPGKHVEPEDDSSPDDHFEAADNGEPGVDDTSNVDETALTSIYGLGK